MSSEMRELIERVVEAAVALERVESSWCGDPNELEVPRRELEDAKSSLLARTEAGADGAVPMNPIGYVDLASWQADWNAGESFFTDYQDEDTQPIYTQAQMEHAIEIAKATRPQDASGDAGFSAADLESLAKCVLASVTPGGFHIPEGWNVLLDKLTAMQAKEAK